MVSGFIHLFQNVASAFSTNNGGRIPILQQLARTQESIDLVSVSARTGHLMVPRFWPQTPRQYWYQKLAGTYICDKRCQTLAFLHTVAALFSAASDLQARCGQCTTNAPKRYVRTHGFTNTCWLYAQRHINSATIERVYNVQQGQPKLKELRASIPARNGSH